MHLVQRIQSDIDLLLLHQHDADTYPYLLETALKSDEQHFDILFAFPQQTLLLKQNALALINNSGIKPATSPLLDANISLAEGDFLNSMDQWWSLEKASSTRPESLPFTGGWFVFLSYELVGQIEPSLQLPSNTQCEPVAYATRIPAAIIKDHATGDLYAVAEKGQQALIDTMLSDIQQVVQVNADEPHPLPSK
ncbi:hypothetical protein, partial [Kaarinaea lacus]